MKSSATKNCHCWRLYLLPLMNWRNGSKPPSSSIITFLSPECNTLFHTSISGARWMCGLQIELSRFFIITTALPPTAAFMGARGNTVLSLNICPRPIRSTWNGTVIGSASGRSGLVKTHTALSTQPLPPNVWSSSLTGAAWGF